MLNFQIDQGKGILIPADQNAAQEQLAALQKIMAETEDGDCDATEASMVKINEMITADPLFLRGYAILGELLFGADREDEATEIYVEGCLEALSIIPEDFQGPMDMDNAEVQCFMRCHTGYIESLMLKGEYAGALKACRRQMAFDPGDMFERYREIGELAVMADELNEAEEILLGQLQRRPTAWYSLGYLSFLKFNYPEAALRLRKAFVAAPYVVDVITARFTAPNLFWESGPQAPSYEEDMLYVHTLGGDMWCDNPKAQAFIEWLSQTSAALRERAEMVAISETCFYRDGLDAESEKAFQTLWDSINMPSSEKLMVSVKDPEGGEELPAWEFLDRCDERRRLDGGEEEEHGQGCGCGNC